MSGKLPYSELKIVALTKEHDISYFNSKSFELNDFLKNDALDDQKYLINKSYICFFKTRITGFFTLSADTIEVKAVDSEDSAPGYEYRKYPALKLARMAVDVEFEKKGIGRFLLYAAIGKALLISEQIGCRYLTVDSKPESVGFYEKHGFKFIKKYKNRDFPPMYLNLYKAFEDLNEDS